MVNIPMDSNHLVGILKITKFPLTNSANEMCIITTVHVDMYLLLLLQNLCLSFGSLNFFFIFVHNFYFYFVCVFHSFTHHIMLLLQESWDLPSFFLSFFLSRFVSSFRIFRLINPWEPNIYFQSFISSIIIIPNKFLLAINLVTYSFFLIINQIIRNCF